MRNISLAQFDAYDTAAQLRRLAAGIAAAFGDGWRYAPGPSSTMVFAEHHDGRRLSLSTAPGFAAEGRARVTGAFPPSWRLRRGERCEATIALRRDPREAAADLRRRLLPGYETLLKQAVADVTAEKLAAADRERVTAQITAAVPGSERRGFGRTPGSIRVRLPSSGWKHHADVTDTNSGTKVDIELHDLDPHVALAMLEALACGFADTGRPAAAAATSSALLASACAGNA
jgi:hypothetical protein